MSIYDYDLIQTMTTNYYDENSEAFLASTQSVEMTSLLEWFTDKVPEGGRILDWGCGSGRDSLMMMKAGYVVEAVDASRAMCETASILLGTNVEQATFQELDQLDRYDGIWANASLLHVPSSELPEILERAANALKNQGVLYASFKLGVTEGVRNGRYFTFMNEDRLLFVLESVLRLSLLEVQVTPDARKDRSDELWLNALIVKEEKSK